MPRRWQRRLRSLGRPLLAALAPPLAGVFRLLAATWRVRVEGEDPFATRPPRRRLGALWHRNLLVAAGVFRDSGIHVPVSRSADGDLVAAVMLSLGLAPPPRGSSRSGGVPLLRCLVRLVRGGEVVGILPDGPLGPARISKPGVIQVARLTGEPIVPVALSARPGLRFGSWDQMLLPLPFARVVCRYGAPLEVGPEVRGPRVETLRAGLDARLDALNRDVDAALGLLPRSGAARGTAPAAPPAGIPALPIWRKWLLLGLTAFVLVPFGWTGLTGRGPGLLPWQIRELWNYAQLFAFATPSWRSHHVQVQGADAVWREVPHGPPFHHRLYGTLTRLDMLLLYFDAGSEGLKPADAARRRRVLRHLCAAYGRIQRPGARRVRLLAFSRPASLYEPPRERFTTTLPGRLNLLNHRVLVDCAVGDAGDA